MRRIYTLSILLLFAVTHIAWGNPVTEVQARKIAAQFMTEHKIPSSNLMVSYRAPRLNASPSTTAPLYVFSATQGSGYAVIAGDDCVPAVLGYSTDDTFDPNNVPPAMQEWLDAYAEQIAAITTGEARFETRTSAGTAIAPMVTARWGQGMPYSVQLPYVPGSSYAHAYTGCVATAMAQLMYYWKYPARPTTTIPGYTSNSGKSTAVTMPSLSPVNFDWDAMQDAYMSNDSTSAAALAAATLNTYCATALQASFGLTSTSGYTNEIPEKLATYFGYKNTGRYLKRQYYNTQSWEDTIYAELEAGRPVVYSARKSSGGHAFVCDGYDGEGMFHINWGWYGKSNGFFLLNLLNPAAEGIGSAAGAYGYVYSQAIALGLEPDNGEGSAVPAPAFSFEGLTINSTNTTRSAASSNFSVTVSGKFVNNTAFTARFRQGWGLYDLDGNLLEVLFIRYTTGDIASGGYVTVSNREVSFGQNITSGTYRIKPIYSIYPGTDYTPCIGSDVNYIEVTISGTYSCTIKGYGEAGSTTKYTVNNVAYEGTFNHGKPVVVNLNLKNTGTSQNDIIYMFVDGEFTGMGLANICPGESGELVYRFTPETAGSKTLTFSLNEDGTSPFCTRTLTIHSMPAATLNVSQVVYLNVTDAANKIITDNKISAVVTVTNAGSTAYDEEFSIRLYRVTQGTTGNEAYNLTQPLQLQAGETKTLQFDFDHDLIDGWQYFVWTYYYSEGTTVKAKGTPVYTLIFPSELDVLRGDVNNDGVVTPADISALIDYLVGGAEGISETNADVNEDGSITPADISALIDMLLN